jgi:hypothetical protein
VKKPLTENEMKGKRTERHTKSVTYVLGRIVTLISKPT